MLITVTKLFDEAINDANIISNDCEHDIPRDMLIPRKLFRYTDLLVVCIEVFGGYSVLRADGLQLLKEIFFQMSPLRYSAS